MLFSVVVALVCTMQAMDPSIESNPGPRGLKPARHTLTPLDAKYEELCKVSTDIVEICSHRFFLQTCKELQLAPRSLQSSVHLSSRKASPKLKELFKELGKSYSNDIIDLIIQDYNHTLRLLLEEQDHLMVSLRELCSDDTFREKTDELLMRKESLCDSLQQRKMKKLNRMLDNDETDAWLPLLNLTSKELGFLMNNEQLCDNIINAAMTLLNKDFPHLQFQSNTLHDTMLVYAPFESIHVHHNGRGHFCTTTSTGGSVELYDSLNHRPSPDHLKQITSIYSPNPPVTPKIQHLHIECTQRGFLVCGIFAIAYATDLAHGANPKNYRYDQDQFRAYLVECFELHKMTQFP